MFYVKGKQSFKCPSPSELDKNYCGEQSLLSALSLEQPSGWKSSNGAVTDRSESRASVPSSLCLSMDIISPCRDFLFHNSNMQEPDNGHLTVPSQGKSSTPNMLVQKPRKTPSFDQSYSDLTASQISWDVSLIKAENSSPRFFVDSSAQEQTWSPKPQPHSVAEVSPWLWRLPNIWTKLIKQLTTEPPALTSTIKGEWNYRTLMYFNFYLINSNKRGIAFICKSQMFDIVTINLNKNKTFTTCRF